jgi:hypothetical protein
MKAPIFLLLCLLFLSCKKDDLHPHDHDDNELITSVQLKFDAVQGNDVTVKAQDKNGDGVFELIEPINLERDVVYDVEVGVYDDSKPVRVDVTESIREESNFHLFVYKILPVNLATVITTDKDKNGMAFGSKAKLTTNNIVADKSLGGKFRIILKHQPPVNGKPVKNGDENLGSTDIDLSFDLLIK